MGLIATIKKKLKHIKCTATLNKRKEEINLARKGRAKQKLELKRQQVNFFSKLIKSYAAKNKNQFYMAVLLKPGCSWSNDSSDYLLDKLYILVTWCKI